MGRKNQSVAQRSQASAAVRLLLQPTAEPEGAQPTKATRRVPLAPIPQPLGSPQHDRHGAPLPDRPTPGVQQATASSPGHGASWEQEYRDLRAAILLRNYSIK